MRQTTRLIWHGYYDYYDMKRPGKVVFTMVVDQNGSNIIESISNNEIGSVKFSCTFDAQTMRIEFRKFYRSGTHDPVNYRGTIDLSSHAVSGIWSIWGLHRPLNLDQLRKERPCADI